MKLYADAPKPDGYRMPDVSRIVHEHQMLRTMGVAVCERAREKGYQQGYFRPGRSCRPAVRGGRIEGYFRDGYAEGRADRRRLRNNPPRRD